jgi:hypothetical protein
MANGLAELWRRAIDANVRYYEEWGRVAQAYVRDLASALSNYSPRISLPTITVPAVAQAPGPPAPAAPAARPEPAQGPAIVLEGAPGAKVQGAVLVQNYLPHPVTASVQAEMAGADIDVVVEPATVELAPGESAVVGITATVPDDPAAPETRGQVLVPELVGTAVPVVLRVRPSVLRPGDGVSG